MAAYEMTAKKYGLTEFSWSTYRGVWGISPRDIAMGIIVKPLGIEWWNTGIFAGGFGGNPQ